MKTKDSVIDLIKKQFSKSQEESEHIYTILLREKFLKVDKVNGGFSLAHGSFWHKTVMDNALKMDI